jgi:hypothetical protein
MDGGLVAITAGVVSSSADTSYVIVCSVPLSRAVPIISRTRSSAAPVSASDGALGDDEIVRPIEAASLCEEAATR